MSVVELLDVSAEAVRLGFRCQVAVFPTLFEHAELAVVLDGLRDALVKNPRHPSSVRLFGAAFGVWAPPTPRETVPSFTGMPALVRAQVLLSGGGGESSTLLFHVDGRRADRAAGEHDDVAVLCMLDRNGRLVLNSIDDTRQLALPRLYVERSLVAQLDRREAIAAPPLFLIYAGQRVRITGDEFVIGRSSAECDLVIRDGLISRRHAAVVCHGGLHYMTDLGSVHGIHHKGVRIATRRIAEGDIFQIGEHALAFTFRVA